MAKKFLTSIDLNKNELQNAVVQNLTTAPGTPVEGQIYYDSTGGDQHIWIYTGAAWEEVALMADVQASDTLLELTDVVGIDYTAGTVIIGDGVDSFDQKAISGDATLAATGALTVSSIGGDAVTLGGAFTTSGAFGTTLTVTALTDVTLPTTGTLATLAGAETLSSKTLTSPVLNTGVSGTAFLDDDSFATATATTLASSESIKAYVDAQIATENTLAEMDDVVGVDYTAGTIIIGDGVDTMDQKAISGDATLAATGALTVSSIGGDAVTLGGAFTTSGAFGCTLTLTALTDVTLPTTGTLATQAYVDGLIAGMKWKQSVVAATTVAGTLISSFENLDVIDGITLATGDRILIKDQASAIENGIYIVEATGAPTRATDADTGAELTSAVVSVDAGTSNADTSWRCTDDTPLVGTDPINFANFGASVPDATTTTKGIVELATVTEAKAKTDTARAVTPASIADFGRVYTGLIGNGALTDIPVTHGLGSQYVISRVFDATTNAEVECDVVNTNGTTVTFTFAVAPTTDQFRVVVIG